jgi:hypothetical protein
MTKLVKRGWLRRRRPHRSQKVTSVQFRHWICVSISKTLEPDGRPNKLCTGFDKRSHSPYCLRGQRLEYSNDKVRHAAGESLGQATNRSDEDNINDVRMKAEHQDWDERWAALEVSPRVA